MAEIPIERRSDNSAWWLWIVVALVVVGLIWWLIPKNETARVAPTTTPMAAVTGPMADISPLYNVNDAAYANRDVASNPVRVLSVSGDRTFWVGDDVGRQALVVMSEAQTAGQPAVTPGQMVRIYGTVEAFPGYEEARRMWNVNANVRSELEDQKVYIAADRLEITQRAN